MSSCSSTSSIVTCRRRSTTGDVSSKAAFAVLPVRLLFALGALHLLLHGEFTVEDQIELCRLYSAEVEYSDDNMDALFDALL